MTDNNKNRFIAILLTVAFHAIVIVLLTCFALKTPLPLPDEAGVEVNLSMYNQGKGFVKELSHSNANLNTKPSQNQKDRETQENESPAIEQEKQSKKTDKEKDTTDKKPVVNPKALFHAPATNDTSSSAGKTEKAGVQGDVKGLKDIEHYEGHGGSGEGTSYYLGGRGFKNIPSPSRELIKEEGKIVVDIWVDKKGKVQRVSIGKGTTITNAEMRNNALEAARNAIFIEDKKAPDLQKGSIIYTYIIRQ